MGLGIRARDAIAVEASGRDADKALELVIPLLGGAQAHPPGSPAQSPPDQVAGKVLKGVVASRGMALGRAILLQEEELATVEAGQGVLHEKAELERARGAVRAHLLALKKQASAVAREVIEAHLEFIDDVDLIERATAEIARGKSAGYAWRASVRESVRILSALDDPRMKERVGDLLDIESQVLRALRGEAVEQTRALPENAVLIARDLKPSQVVTLDASRIAGLCTARGGATSHVAILAASMGVPALVALGDDVLSIGEGTWLMLDAEAGRLHRLDDERAKHDAENLLLQKRERARNERIAAQQECRTADGVRVHVWANLAGLADAQAAVTQGAEGCGLLRTEFLFLDRPIAPDEREQLEQYQGVARVLGERPLTIRTLDIGGDKPVPYLSLPNEPNPALGLRGVRTSLWRPDLLRTQLRALLRTEPARNLRILIPMVTDITEVQTVRSLLEDIASELGLNNLPPLGAMIETPASALLAPELAEVVDFFSIGTNDLTQYVLAMDREHSDLAARIDGLHPAVLRTMRLVSDAASARQREIAVCGGLASDPAAAAILIGLGIRELSCVPSSIPQLKATIRVLRIDACERLAAQALEAKTAEEVRGLVGRDTDVNVWSSV
jgi:phosphoenolpyruvate-protein phosphotransferase